MDRVILLGEFNTFEEGVNGLRGSTSDGYNDDEFTSDEMEVELEELHHSIDIKEDIPIVDYQQDSNEKIPSHSNGYFQIKTEIVEEMENNLEDLHHSIDIKEETHVDQDCDIPLPIRAGKKSFECNICDYKCLRKGNLKSHLRTHTSEKQSQTMEKCVLPQRTKYCFVPGCTNTTASTPEKVFMAVPDNDSRKKKWFAAVRRFMPTSKSVYFCCEDHFNLEEDMENYIRFKLMGGKVFFKQGVVPHIFNCQPDRKSASSSRERSLPAKLQRRRLVDEAIRENHKMYN